MGKTNEIICKKTGEKYSSYNNYLNSKEWQSKRAEAFKKNGFCCFYCKSKKNLEIHHKTYKRLGNERVNDLMVLCKECHKKVHLLKKTYKTASVSERKKITKYQKYMLKA